MKVLDLFSGIGGFSLGLERAGMATIAFCEQDKACQKVLRRHWPNIPIHDDVRTLDGTQFKGHVDVICGGFPCQDISFCGKGAGLEGERSGLWWEFHRIIKEANPPWVIIENVSALRSRGLEEVLWSLFEVGYDAEWHCIPASAVGAPHQRDRVWIIGYTNDSWKPTGHVHAEASWVPEPCGISYSMRQGLEGCCLSGRIQKELTNQRLKDWWANTSFTLRMDDGLPGRVDRLKQLGNAVVPQIPEIIGRAIMEANHDTH